MIMDWNGLQKEKVQLGLLLLIIKGERGFLGCGYINVDACNRTGEACALVIGVKTHEDMLDADIKAVSREAERLGVRVGMKGREALELFR
ncbi:MAG: YunC family protein [Deltaproteobacteria bacterium]|nr:YunC family protein [Deltaproteobacteria bacterium]